MTDAASAMPDQTDLFDEATLYNRIGELLESRGWIHEANPAHTIQQEHDYSERTGLGCQVRSLAYEIPKWVPGIIYPANRKFRSQERPDPQEYVTLNGTPVKAVDIKLEDGSIGCFYPRWGEIWLNGDDEPRIADADGWLKDFVLHRIAFAPILSRLYVSRRISSNLRSPVMCMSVYHPVILMKGSPITTHTEGNFCSIRLVRSSQHNGPALEFRSHKGHSVAIIASKDLRAVSNLVWGYTSDAETLLNCLKQCHDGESCDILSYQVLAVADRVEPLSMSDLQNMGLTSRTLVLAANQLVVYARPPIPDNSL